MAYLGAFGNDLRRVTQPNVYDKSTVKVLWVAGTMPSVAGIFTLKQCSRVH